VRCFDETGAPVDWWFFVTFASLNAEPADRATVRYDAAGGTGSPSPVLNDGTSNSEGGLNHVEHLGTGRYRVVLDGAAFARDTGFTQLTPFGAGPPATCGAEGTRPIGAALEITVACHALTRAATPQPVDAQWLLTYVRGVGLHGLTSTPAAYLTTAGDPTSPAVDAAHSFSSDGEVPTIVRQGVGRYRVTYETLGKEPDSFQVSSTTSQAYCHVASWNSYAAAPRVTVDVYCFSLAGTAVDSNFGLAYPRAP
jgi:hypothetical protein